MPHSFTDALRLYDYSFPEELIAQKPVSPRDSAKVLVFKRATGEIFWDTFNNIGHYLPANCVLVLNETKVIPAKLILNRKSGGKVSVLIIGREEGAVRVMANRKLIVGEVLTFSDSEDIFTVEKDAGKYWILRPSFPSKDLDPFLDRSGHMPLPPYIKHSPLTPEELKTEYQTVFASERGSIAAPTASLHFTEELLASLEKSGITIVKVTLHVHLGTFAPLTEDQWTQESLHHEHYYINASAVRLLESAKKEGRPIIAVGTTVVRTLESASDSGGRIVRPEGDTSLFIREGYTFHVVDGIITNFHVPKSSLLMLVSAFAGREKILDLYHQAIAQRFRLFSFGDGMLLL